MFITTGLNVDGAGWVSWVWVRDGEGEGAEELSLGFRVRFAIISGSIVVLDFDGEVLGMSASDSVSDDSSSSL